MTRFALPLLLAATVLAGCGRVPTAPIAAKPVVTARATAASADARRVTLRVPARVVGYAEAYVAELVETYGREMDHDMYGRPTTPKVRVVCDMHSRDAFKVVASADGFKTRLEENGYNDYRRQDGRDVLVPFVAPVGAVRYYVEVRAELRDTVGNKLVKALPVRYVSNLGANYEGRLEEERN